MNIGNMVSGCTALLLGIGLSAQAATSAWTKYADGSWSDPLNWDNGVPNAVGAVAVITNEIAPATYITNDVNLTLGKLQIGSPNPLTAFFITTNELSTSLTFDNGGAGAELVQIIPVSATSNDYIHSPIVLADNLTVTNVGPKYVYLSGPITESGGPKSLTKTGAGNLALSSTANSFSGGVVVKAGGVTGPGKMGTGPITLGDTTGNATVQLFGSSGTYTNAIMVPAGGSGAKTLRASGTGGAITFSGPIQLDNVLTLHGQSSSANNFVSGSLSGDGSIRVTGSGAPAYVTLSSTTSKNTFTGGVTLESGILRFQTDSGFGTGSLTLKAGVFASGGTGTRNATNDTTISGNIQFGHALGTGNLNLCGPIDLGDVTRTFTISNSSTVFTNVVSGTAGVIKKGSGTLTFRGANTFTGPVTLREGSVSAQPFAAYDPLGLVPSTPTTNLLIFDGGTLVFGRACFIHANRGVTVTTNNGTIGGTVACGINGIIEGPGTLFKIGSSRLSLANANTFTGGFVFGEGKLRIGNDQVFGSGPLTISNGVTFVTYYATSRTVTNPVSVYGDFTMGTTIVDEFGTLTLAGPMDIGDMTRSITVPEADGSNVVGVISGRITGTGGISKFGMGTLTLSGPNTYSGATALAEGELNISTAASASGGITANDGTTLGFIRDAIAPKLTASSLALGSYGAGMSVAFFLPTGASSTPVVDASSLTAYGSVTVQIYGGNFVPGQYPLIKFTGTIAGGGSFVATPSVLPAGLDAQIVTTATSIDLKVNSFTPGALTWNGDANNLWDFASLNWTNNAGKATFFPGASVSVVDLATNIAPYMILTGPMQPSAMTVDRNTNGMTIAGMGSLEGPMTLTKTGTNMLTISAQNNYSGGTAVNEGSLRVLNLAGSATGSGAVTVNSGATLQGNGFIAGPVVVGGGANLGVGTMPLGILTLNNSLSLASGSTTLLQLDKAAGTNEVIVAGPTSFGGTLAVTNISGELTGGETFKLFSTTGQSGNFASVAVLGSTLTGQFDPATGLLTITGGMASYPTNISYSFSSGSLSMSWPETHKGWYAQSNATDVADSAAWFDISGSESGTSLDITVDPASPKVFYRLRKP